MNKVLALLLILFFVANTGNTQTWMRLKQVSRLNVFSLMVPGDTSTANPGQAKRQALFTVSPNPVRSIITIQAQQDAPEAMIHIYDTNAKAIYAIVKPLYANASTLMNVANLSPGVYMLSIEANGSKTDIKIVKE